MELQRSRIAERQQLGQSLLLEQIKKMTPEARIAYADALDTMLNRRGKRRH